MAAAVALLIASIDFHALCSAYECAQLSWSPPRTDPPWMLRSSDAAALYSTREYAAGRTPESLELRDEKQTPVTRAPGPFNAPSVTLLSESVSGPRLWLDRNQLRAVCAPGVHGNCVDSLKELEQLQVEQLLSSPSFIFRQELSVDIVLAATPHPSDHEIQAFESAVDALVDRVGGALTAVLSTSVSSRALNADSWSSDGADLDWDHVLMNIIPSQVADRRSTSDITLVIYRLSDCSTNDPAGIKGFTSPSGGTGLVVVGPSVHGCALGDALVALTRDLVGIPSIDAAKLPRLNGADYLVAAVPPEWKDVFVTASPIHGSDFPLRISPWEVRWVELAYIQHAAGMLAKLSDEALFHCGTVLDWSTEQYRARDMLHDYYSMVRDTVELASLFHRPWKDTSNGTHLEQAFRKAQLIETAGRRISSGGHLQRPSYFPFEYRVAVYAPFWAPILIPLFHGLLVEFRRYSQKSTG